MASLFVMIIRRMLRNRWLVASLLTGIVIAVALVSSIPAFTSGVLQRMLFKDLEDYQQHVGNLVGGLNIDLHFNKQKPENLVIFQSLESDLVDEADSQIGLPVLSRVTILHTLPFAITYDRNGHVGERVLGNEPKLISFSQMEQHIEIVDGRLPNPHIEKGIIETIIPEKTLAERQIVLGQTFHLQSANNGGKELLIRPVGIFKAKAGADPYWFATPESYSSCFIVDERLFREQFLQSDGSFFSEARFYTAYDYHAVRIQQVDQLKAIQATLKDKVQQQGVKDSEYSYTFPISSLMEQYQEKKAQYHKILWTLFVPVLVMLALYLIMVSGLIIDRQRSEIAVLSSRGASRTQMIRIYLLETSLLGLLALLVGPPLGLVLSKMLGVSNGFLQFVSRKALPIYLSSQMYTYAILAVLACIVIVMLPVIQATRQNIVTFKQASARQVRNVFWHTYFFDVLLLGISVYGWYSYRQKLTAVSVVGKAGKQLEMDPLLFFVPAIFVVGLGLFLLRFYPYLIRLIYWIGRAVWPPTMYSTLIQVGRSSVQYQFLMVFIVMTIAVGLFSAGAARTYNQNLEDERRYESGADMTLQVEWTNDKPVQLVIRGSKNQEGPEEKTKPTVVTYQEPPFEPYADLPGVEHAAKVFRKDLAEVSTNGKDYIQTELMGIQPKEFGQTAWFKPNLLPHHWFEYLNLLAKEPSAILISQSVADKMHVDVGHTLSVTWKDGRKADCIIYAIINYWPAWNPLTNGTASSSDKPLLIVGNLEYFQQKINLEPYEVWLKMKPNVSSQAIYQNLKEQHIPLLGLTDTRQEMIQVKNSAFLLGLNGAMTLGFLISMGITLIGFILYWVLTLFARKLQYGVLRALGMSFCQLVMMLAWEQLLTFGMACILGIMIGKVCNLLFLPLFSLYFNKSAQVPPFEIITLATDEGIVYGFVGFSLVVGLAILMSILSRFSIHQAVKLGED
ncbi:FtsX-like permease family protein [Brevibacillus ginsengisoli]|uniref:ABC transporter permease n=1 Tax=Brevibacillus ginsengisoli TaxID=363854 RepID=UPI003CF7B876